MIFFASFSTVESVQVWYDHELLAVGRTTVPALLEPHNDTESTALRLQRQIDALFEENKHSKNLLFSFRS
jgi:hypothetical protein